MPSVRLLVVFALLIVGSGCFGSKGLSAADVGDDDNLGGLPPQAACMVNEDCVPAAATCCECPTFATSLDDPKAQACFGVDCGPPDDRCATNVEARCDQNTCVLACAPLACLDCPSGYFTEANGCLSCTCDQAPMAQPTCAADSDCVRTRADCCGCTQGGEDTAVPTAEASAFDSSLNCGSMPQCPGVSNQSCDLTAQARCVRGQCALATEGMPADACGRPDLPACPSGTVCKINVNDSASLYGVGVCRP